MIPRIIHYCWFGHGTMPESALKCIESWHRCMPDWEYKLWNEDSFDINSFQYTKEAYMSQKFAFVSDVARLVALNKEGGLYLDVDFVVYRSFEYILHHKAFAGFEGSKTKPVMMGVIASEPGGTWVNEQLELYRNKAFIVDGKEDVTTNVRMITDNMILHGFVPNGKEQDYKDLHVFPVDYFCPKQTTGEYLRTPNTYCEQLGSSSWASSESGWKSKLLSIFSPSARSTIIKIKRMILD